MKAEQGVSRSEAIRRAVGERLRRKQIEEFKALAGSRLVNLDWRVAEAQELKEHISHGRKTRSR